ncbi:MAG: GNAT family N-acetyltransferase, partial [Pseudomonadota bacterium]
ETSWVYTANSASAVQGLMVLQVTEMEADLLTVCVDPACQRAGLGRGLLLFGMDALWQSGVKVLRLDVAADNAAAIAFYRAFGFDDDGRRLKYYRRGNGVRVDGVLMSRSLAGHGATKKA